MSIEGLIHIPEEGIISRIDINRIREVKTILEYEVEDVIKEDNYELFIDKMLSKLKNLESSNVSYKAKEQFLEAVAYNGNFFHLGDDIFEVFSGETVSKEQLEKLSFSSNLGSTEISKITFSDGVPKQNHKKIAVCDFFDLGNHKFSFERVENDNMKLAHFVKF